MRKEEEGYGRRGILFEEGDDGGKMEVMAGGGNAGDEGI